MYPFLANLLRFGRLLHALGLGVHAGRTLDAARALPWIDIGDRMELRLALRALLVHRYEDLAAFDEAFDRFWRAPRREGSGRPLASLGERLRVRVTRGGPAETALALGELPAGGAAADLRVPIRTYSPGEVLRTKDFAALTAEELVAARTVVRSLSWDVAPRRTRRWEAGRGRAFDPGRLVRRNLRYGGELVTLPRRRRRTRPRPLVVLCDVSGSMERYSRMLLQFVHAVARRRGRVEAFVFATRLTRITTRLGKGAIDEAVAGVGRAVPDWAGGTRIGEALGAFNRGWGRRLMGHGPTVLLISDGWDRGDPERLRAEVARLQRRCHRLIWLNPLLGSPAYEPLTRGMQAALRYVDDFLPVHNLASLEALAAHLGTLSASRPARGTSSTSLQARPVRRG